MTDCRHWHSDDRFLFVNKGNLYYVSVQNVRLCKCSRKREGGADREDFRGLHAWGGGGTGTSCRRSSSSLAALVRRTRIDPLSLKNLLAASNLLHRPGPCILDTHNAMVQAHGELALVHPLEGSMKTVLVAPADKVQHSEAPFRNAQGLLISSHTFAPPAGVTPLGSVLLLHGLNTHVSYSFASYEYTYAGSVLQRYVDAQIIVHGMDMPGFGKSEGVGGKRGHLLHMHHAVDDTLQLCAILKACHPFLPLFLHGQCFGGAVATLVLQRAPPSLLRGCVLTVPNIVIAPEAIPSAVIVGALGCIASVAPTLPILHEPEDSDQDFQFRFASDPFCYAGAIRRLVQRAAPHVHPLRAYAGRGQDTAAHHAERA